MILITGLTACHEALKQTLPTVNSKTKYQIQVLRSHDFIQQHLAGAIMVYHSFISQEWISNLNQGVDCENNDNLLKVRDIKIRLNVTQIRLIYNSS
jgi:hypothetical protein